MKQRLLAPLCGLTLFILSASGQEQESIGPSVIVVPTLDTEVQKGNVAAWSAAMPSMWQDLCDQLPEVAILRPAIAVNAYGSRSTFAEPANSETKAVVKRYRDLATAAKFSWIETSSP